jgi:hypothetical protein
MDTSVLTRTNDGWKRLGLLPSRISIPPAIYAKALEILVLDVH